jgi:hypothetical protein
MGLERGPLSLVSTIEELVERKSSGSGLKNRDYGRRHSSRWPHSTLYPQKFTLASPTSGGRSVGIVRSRTQAPEFVLFVAMNVSGSFARNRVSRCWQGPAADTELKGGRLLLLQSVRTVV